MGNRVIPELRAEFEISDRFLNRMLTIVNRKDRKMAKLDLGMAIEYFVERNNREPGATELPMIQEVLLSTSFLAGKEDFERAWLEYAHPAVPESDVDWEAIGSDMSKWGMI